MARTVYSEPLGAPSLTIEAGEYSYRQLRAGDEGDVFAACRFRADRPSYAACVTLLSDQLTVDELTPFYDPAPEDAAAVRRLLAFDGDRCLAMVTATLPADPTSAAVLDVDPADLDAAPQVAADAQVWVERFGYGSITVTVYGADPADLTATANPLQLAE